MNIFDLTQLNGGIMPSGVLPTLIDGIKRLLSANKAKTNTPPEEPIEQTQVKIPELSSLPNNEQFQAGTSRLSALLKGINLILQNRNNTKAKNEEMQRDLAIDKRNRIEKLTEYFKQNEYLSQKDAEKQARDFENRRELVKMDQDFKRPEQEVDIAYKKAMTNRLNASGSAAGDGPRSSGAAAQIDLTKVSDEDLQNMGVNVAAFRAADSKGQQQILRNVAARRQQAQNFNVEAALKLADQYELANKPQEAAVLRDRVKRALLGETAETQAPKSIDVDDYLTGKNKPNSTTSQPPQMPALTQQPTPRQSYLDNSLPAQTARAFKTTIDYAGQALTPLSDIYERWKNRKPLTEEEARRLKEHLDAQRDQNIVEGY